MTARVDTHLFVFLSPNSLAVVVWHSTLVVEESVLLLLDVWYVEHEATLILLTLLRHLRARSEDRQTHTGTHRHAHQQSKRCGEERVYNLALLKLRS